MSQTSRADLRLLAQWGDVDAAVELGERCKPTSMKAFLAVVCAFETPLTTELFDTVADAYARLNE
jgi:hypothetical protein